ncbi:MAG: hypothetical protein ATN32_09665 [Candidatus Epulonipiscium fishelsonii]|nr:MAG: hypothetical protein ATN32_09665 [Epulopiscium sp. AS2M-Bin002]
MIIHPNLHIGKYSSLDKVYFGNIRDGSIKIGNNCSISRYVCIMPFGGHIKIGNNCCINPFSIIYGHGNLTIGNNVLIATQCVIIPANHKFDRLDIPIRLQGETRKGIIIEDNVWIGSNVKILDGVKIGAGAVIGSGSVVNKDIPKNAIAVGVPAKVKKYR